MIFDGEVVRESPGKVLSLRGSKATVAIRIQMGNPSQYAQMRRNRSISPRGTGKGSPLLTNRRCVPFILRMCSFTAQKSLPGGEAFRSLQFWADGRGGHLFAMR